MSDLDETEIRVEDTMVAGVKRVRRRSLLEQWLVNDEISREMYDAGFRFEHDFDGAQLRDHYGTHLTERVSGTQGQRENYIVSVLHARKRVQNVLDALGSVASSVLWDILGNQMSLREHSTRQQCNGKPINVHQAKGRLIAALDMLARHYGFN